VGMLTVGIAASGLKIGKLRTWVISGCVLSAIALITIATLGQLGLAQLFTPAVVFLGFSNGMFAVAAIGSMMQLAGQGRRAREGTRMGLWGAAQAIAAGFGGLLGAALVDLMRIATNDALAFGAVFSFEAALFIAAAVMAGAILNKGQTAMPNAQLVPGE